MTRVFPRTREREKAWKLGGLCAAGSLIAAPFVTMIFRGLSGTRFTEASFSATYLGSLAECALDSLHVLFDP